MIKNQKQASVTRQKLTDLINAKQEFLQNSTNNKDAKHRLGVKSFDSLISELEYEIREYEGLINGNFHSLRVEHLNDIPKVLIAARLAQRISQKQLGELVGLKEQQIQRYEATDYETASWPRIVEISMALNLNLSFKEIIIINTSDDCFDSPEGITAEQMELASQHIRQHGLLII